nr:hypothetical protein GCM10020063_061030 [Dactylosporangium thailandense]
MKRDIINTVADILLFRAGKGAQAVRAAPAGVDVEVRSADRLAAAIKICSAVQCRDVHTLTACTAPGCEVDAAQAALVWRAASYRSRDRQGGAAAI